MKPDVANIYKAESLSKDVILLSMYESIAAVHQTFTFSNSTIKALKKKSNICSELTIKTPERCQLRCYGVFIVNLKHVFYLFLVCFFVNFEHVFAG